MSSFKHKGFRSNHDIRLGKIMLCKSEVSYRDNAPYYAALSYTWGEASEAILVTLDVIGRHGQPYTFLSNVKDILGVPPEYLGTLRLGCINAVSSSTGRESWRIRNLCTAVSKAS